MADPSIADQDLQGGVIAASVAGGIGSQFRVQFRDGTCTAWQHYAAFRKNEDAVRCENTLRANGLTPRVVRYRHCPTAA